MRLNYEIEKLTLEEIKSDNSKVKIPQFQRGLVWSKKIQERFIDTMLQGDPFGAILVSKNDDGTFDLIDGLQRVSTIKRFLKNPKDFINENFIDKNLLDKLIKLMKKYNKLPSQKDFILHFKKQIIRLYNQSNEISTLTTDIANIFNVDDVALYQELSYIAEKIVKDLDSKIKLRSAIIPMIVYTGDKNNLPDVFERMNTGSVTLSKYEVLASTWYRDEKDIDNKEISDCVKKKYIDLRDNSEMEFGFNIEDLDAKINIFEYCYALGEILKDRSNDFNVLFGIKQKKTATDSLGFDLLTVLLGHQINEVEKIKSFLVNADSTFLITIMEAFKETSKFIVKTIKGFLRDDNDENKYYNVITGYQAIHIFVSIFKTLYEFDQEKFTCVRRNNKKEKNNIKKYLSLNIFYDVIKNYWNDNRQVSDLHYNITNNQLLNKYQNDIDDHDISLALNEYIDKANENTRKNIPVETKYILGFMHKINIKNNIKYKKFFEDKYIDFEHISPKDRIKDIETKVAVNSIANLCVMLPKDNRSKQINTIYEDKNKRSIYMIDNEMLDLMVYPKEDELRFLDLVSEQKEIYFNQFIRNRKNTLEKKLIESINIYRGFNI